MWAPTLSWKSILLTSFCFAGFVTASLLAIPKMFLSVGTPKNKSYAHVDTVSANPHSIELDALITISEDIEARCWYAASKSVAEKRN